MRQIDVDEVCSSKMRICYLNMKKLLRSSIDVKDRKAIVQPTSVAIPQAA